MRSLFRAVYTGTRPGLTPAIGAGKGWRGRRGLAPRCSATQLGACFVMVYRQRSSTHTQVRTTTTTSPPPSSTTTTSRTEFKPPLSLRVAFVRVYQQMAAMAAARDGATSARRRRIASSVHGTVTSVRRLPWSWRRPSTTALNVRSQEWWKGRVRERCARRTTLYGD